MTSFRFSAARRFGQSAVNDDPEAGEGLNQRGQDQHCPALGLLAADYGGGRGGLSCGWWVGSELRSVRAAGSADGSGGRGGPA